MEKEERKKTKMDEELLEDAHVLLHPIRYRIVELLTTSSMHINAISKAMKQERRLVTYHLQALEDHGFVSSKYEISEDGRSKGKAIRRYWVTDKVGQMLAALKDTL
jgi:DNA-binding transcriptional ArsR family regulator